MGPGERDIPMKFDDLNLLVSEIGEAPAIYGDSAANSARHQILTNGALSHTLTLFFNYEGLEVRHPYLDGYVSDKGESWGADDFSVDQWLPLFIACMLLEPLLAKRMLENFLNRKYRVGDGSFPNLLMVSAIKRAARRYSFISDLPILLHALFSYFPFRWSDADGLKWYQRIQRSTDSTSDYLNFLMCLLQGYKTNTVTVSLWLAKIIIGKNRMKRKIASYFAKEPNSEFIIEAYFKAIDSIFYRF